ncbi:glycosyltransferase family 4 protein [Lachnospiraceae bacterium OttesenSCG-928-D06]|nr:glycosyltransferase family 4 protein [Lachnospiraceae bacterium OttesenSCG-928-D06]
MKKVLILTTIGGFLQQFEMNDVAALQELGYEVHYASNFHHPVYDMDMDIMREKGIHLHHIDIQKSPAHLFYNMRALRQLLKIIKKEQIHVFHLHNPLGGVLGRVVSFFYKDTERYIIYTAHGFHFYTGAPKLNWLLYYPIERLLGKRTNCLITINQEDYHRGKGFSLKSPGKVVRIPGVGVDIKKFSPTVGKRKEMRDKYKVSEDTFYILSVGELNHNKNHEVILHAMAILKDKRIHYSICGTGYHEEYLKNLAAKLGLEEQFTLFGYKKNIPEMLQLADCFAFPSIREGFGIAAIEALAGGIPLITSDCRGTREYMEDGINGCICQSGSAEEYAQIIRTLIDNPSKREDMKKACMKKAMDFDMARTNGIMKQVYKELP